jgi:hypothetical protein
VTVVGSIIYIMRTTAAGGPEYEAAPLQALLDLAIVARRTARGFAAASAIRRQGPSTGKSEQVGVGALAGRLACAGES